MGQISTNFKGSSVEAVGGRSILRCPFQIAKATNSTSIKPMMRRVRSLSMLNTSARFQPAQSVEHNSHERKLISPHGTRQRGVLDTSAQQMPVALTGHPPSLGEMTLIGAAGAVGLLVLLT
jgi:hypothetical protein